MKNNVECEMLSSYCSKLKIMNFNLGTESKETYLLSILCDSNEYELFLYPHPHRIHFTSIILCHPLFDEVSLLSYLKT